MNVIILAAGAGQRMRGLDFPKPLLPVNGVPLITHTMRACPPDSIFYIAVNSEADVLKDYLEMQDEFIVHVIDVGMPTDTGAGPGTSLRTCLDVVRGPSMFTVADGLFYLPKELPEGNWLATYPLEREELGDYCKIRGYGKLETDERRIIPSDTSWQAWTGIGFIQDWEDALDNLWTAEEGERQCSAAWKTGEWTTVELESWSDLGTREKYDREQLGSLDYRKKGALALKAGSKFIKVFPSVASAGLFYDRHFHIGKDGSLGPKNVEWRRRVVSYDMIPGITAYKAMRIGLFTPHRFAEMLEHFRTNLWYSSFKYNVDLSEFFKTKTFERVRAYLGDDALPPEIAAIDWSIFKDGIWVRAHGDLQFDNIIIDETGDFKLIDWRTTFTPASHPRGDIYYDFGKLLSGIWLDIDKAKLGPGWQYSNGNWIAECQQAKEYEEVLRKFHEMNGYDWKRTQILAATCFIGMSGVHTEPYASAFYDLGIKHLGAIA